MRSPFPKLDLVEKRLPVTVAVTALLLVATATVYLVLPDRDGEQAALRTDDLGASTTVDGTPSPNVNSSSGANVTTTAAPEAGDATSSSADEPEPNGGSGGSGEAGGMPSQFDFHLGGADGSQFPSCAADYDDIADGIVVYPGTTVEMLRPSVVCFPGLAVEEPVDVTITAPGGATTMTAAGVTDGLRVGHLSPVRYVDFTRHPRDPAGEYTIRALGPRSLAVTVLVVEPDQPVVSAVANDGSMEIVAAGFPPSRSIGIGVYREPGPTPSTTYDLVESFTPITDERGRASVLLPMPPPDVPGTDLYGVLTSPESLSADSGGDANGRLLFRWPP